MAVTKTNDFQPEVLFDNDGNVIASTIPDIRRLAVDAFVSGGSAATTPNRADFFPAQVNVPTPGTAVQGPTQAIPNGFALVIKGKTGNTGSVWIGATAAEAQNHAVAYELAAGEEVSLAITNVDLIFVDADVATEGVNLIVEV